jgi:tRNA U34 5-methylaminomethyl-2-thiouridine-forming methyltransferase MnmC
VYQDAFSSDVNRELWSVEYFNDIFKVSNEDVIMTTYSVATPVRLSMYEAGFEIYEIKPLKRKQTLAFKYKVSINAKYIDMEHKKRVNKEAYAIHDQ